ncbi:ankyrin repeat domain-containing protein [Candidatus Cardinium hertigii]|jgi:ankyrin repeat protein|nr:ankyrin repeat domain-containing protein [Candidatus Cardinium hertigii]
MSCSKVGSISKMNTSNRSNNSTSGDLNDIDSTSCKICQGQYCNYYNSKYKEVQHLQELITQIEIDNVEYVENLDEKGILKRIIYYHNSKPINERNIHGLLHIVAMKKLNVKILRLLLKGGLNPNEFNEEGFTALHYACGCDALSIRELVYKTENGLKGERDEMPRKYITKLDKDHIECLLDYRADPNIQDRVGKNTSLHHLLSFTSTSKHDDVTLISDDEETYLECIKALLEKEAKIDIPNEEGRPPLHMLIENAGDSAYTHLATALEKIFNSFMGEVRIRQHNMLNPKVNLVDIVDSDGDTLLHQAVRLKNNALTERIIVFLCMDAQPKDQGGGGAGANRFIKNDFGNTPLHEAARCDNEVAILALTSGLSPENKMAYLNYENSKGKKAVEITLDMAIRKGHASCLEVLSKMHEMYDSSWSL